MSTLLFGSIGTLADTSELQRQAFNDAFKTHDLPWQWDREEYQTLLASSGGADRISEYAKSTGTDGVDATAVHQTKSERFRELLAEAPPALRDGVADTIKAGRTGGHKLALVTTTSPENVDAILTALAPAVSRDDFDLIVDTTQVDQPKPDPAAYRFALEQLNSDAADAVAIEDNVGGVQAARAADLRCFGFPGSNNAAHDFSAATKTVERLDLDELTAA
ncbi:Protein CbbY [Paraconexibacter sp. AEG42_29]|uniref:Protein CbbY n=1 Tax=Paraconexibacter sp. AEG42_29 TaxID=2997339 RepID=A0AAU7B1M0_9ACTN